MVETHNYSNFAWLAHAGQSGSDSNQFSLGGLFWLLQYQTIYTDEWFPLNDVKLTQHYAYHVTNIPCSHLPMKMWTYKNSFSFTFVNNLDPMGVKISKRYSYNLQPKVLKFVLIISLPIVLTKPRLGFLKFSVYCLLVVHKSITNMHRGASVNNNIGHSPYH